MIARNVVNSILLIILMTIILTYEYPTSIVDTQLSNSLNAQNSPDPQPSQTSPPCPNDCNRRGTCVSGKCQCTPGYSGVECEFIMIHTSFLSVIGVMFGACGVGLGVTCFCVGVFALVSSIIQKRRLNSDKYQIMADDDLVGNDEHSENTSNQTSNIDQLNDDSETRISL